MHPLQIISGRRFLTKMKFGAFERSTTTRSFKLPANSLQEKDIGIISPAKITTLNIVREDSTSSVFQLEFRAVGDDFEYGKGKLSHLRQDSRNVIG